jgi:DNA topoisomerase VI subunit B
VKVLERTVFEISRELEFFTEKELQMQIGHGREWWPVALLKELIDNALDACETANVAPVIEVAIDPDGFSVRDNGPGIPQEVLARSLDYLVRVSDKYYYVSPTRGQMGNALKVVWAAPFVARGDYGRVEVWSRGLHHVVEASVDRLAQRPAIEHSAEEDGFVRNGAFVKVHWPEAASLLSQPGARVYIPAIGVLESVPSAGELIENYAAFNPHATFAFGGMMFEAAVPGWRKWRPGDPTSPHWYTPETLRDLVAAYIAGGQKRRTVREFVSEFRGLSSTAKQKEVARELTGVYLADLVQNGDVDMPTVQRLLADMQAAYRPPKPAALGVIGGEHVKAWMVRCAGVTEESTHYRKALGEDKGLPYVVEVGFGVCKGDHDGRRIVTGLNWSPALGFPVPLLQTVLGQMRVDPHDPVTLVVHLARPRFEFVDRGKTRLQL